MLSGGSPHDDASDEMTTAISYYLLYSEINRSTSSAKQSKDAVSTQTEDAVWHEDEWTEQDTLDGESILQEAQERCNVQQQKHLTTLASNDWNDFYKQHETNFFKDRHYLQQSFPKEMSSPSTLVEIGCGVGNALLPLLEKGWTMWGLDLSNVAIDLLKKEPRFLQSEGRAHAHVWDISKPLLHHHEETPPWCGVAHVTTLLFCLSALDPKDMDVAAVNVAATLKPGGTLLLRDYGRYDEAQLKLGTSRGKRLGENFYQKYDGTRVYYFTLEDLE